MSTTTQIVAGIQCEIKVLRADLEALRSDFSTAQAGNRDALTALADRIEHLRNDFRREAVGATKRVDYLARDLDLHIHPQKPQEPVADCEEKTPTSWAIVTCDDPFEPKYIAIGRMSRLMNGRTFGEDVLVFDYYTDAESVANGYENAVIVRMDEETMVALPNERAV